MRLARSADNAQWEAGIYGAVYQANLAIARAVQERARKLLADSIVRPDQRTGRLEEAVGDSRAVYADAQRIIIGVADYLDSVARYWRPVEEGAPKLADIIWYGFWVNAPRFAGVGKGELHGPMEGVKTGRPIVMSVNEPPFGAKHFFTWRIHNVPEGKFFFAHAWEEARSGLIEQIYQDEIAKVTGPDGRPLRLAQLFRGRTGTALTRASFGL